MIAPPWRFVLFASTVAAVSVGGATTAHAHNSRRRELTTAFTADFNVTSEVFIKPFCDNTIQWCLDVPSRDYGGGYFGETNQERAQNLVGQIKSMYRDFNDPWIERIEAEIIQNPDVFVDATKIGIGEGGVDPALSVYAIGIVLDNIYGINYLDNHFQADMRVYLYKVTPDRPLRSLEAAFDDAFSDDVNVVEFPNRDKQDAPYVELLDEEWAEVKGDARYEHATPQKYSACSGKYTESMQPITVDEYKAMGGLRGAVHGGLQIEGSPIVPVPVGGEGGGERPEELLYLKVNNAKIRFDPPNAKFFPFQTNILDINLFFPRQREMDRTIFCIDYKHTGVRLPMESVHRKREDILYLSLVPSIRRVFAPPFLGRDDYSHMRNSFASSDKSLQHGNKIVYTASFRVIHITEFTEGMAVLLPFLFTIFSTQLQWLVVTPDKAEGSKMVAALLLLQNVVNAQKNYIVFNNIATKVVYLTYGIVVAYIVSISLLTFINNMKERGQCARLVRHRGMIFWYLRLFTLLLTFLLIPILCYETDHKTGEQTFYEWLLYLIGFSIIAVLCLNALWDYQKLKKRRRAEAADAVLQKDDPCRESIILAATEPTSDWTAEHVGRWIGECEFLVTSSSLTEAELQSIAEKFVAAGITGEVFPKVAYDAKVLKDDVNLTIGEAFLFVHSMEKLKAAKHEHEVSEECAPKNESENDNFRDNQGGSNGDSSEDRPEMHVGPRPASRNDISMEA